MVVPVPLPILEIRTRGIRYDQSLFFPTFNVDFPQAFLSPFYASEVQTAVNAISDPTQKTKALSMANIPTFAWLDVVAKIPSFGDQLANARSLAASSGWKYLVQVVAYDLSDRDCAAAASNGEFSIAASGLTKYMNYIDQIVAQI